MIRKVGHSLRQGFGKFKNKSNHSDGDARFPVPTSNEDPPFANRSFVSPVQGSRDSPSAPSYPLWGSSLNKKGKNAIQTSEDSVALSNLARCQFPDKIAQAMEDCAKVTPNGHLRRSTTRTSRHEPQRARSKRLADLLSPRYSQSNPPLFLPFQNPFLQLLGKERIRKTWAPSPQGKWREKIYQLPEQRNQTREAR